MGERIGNLSDVRGRQQTPMTDDEIARQLENSEPADVYKITGIKREEGESPKLNQFGELAEEDK
jgi:hypothetical protein